MVVWGLLTQLSHPAGTRRRGTARQGRGRGPVLPGGTPAAGLPSATCPSAPSLAARCHVPTPSPAQGLCGMSERARPRAPGVLPAWCLCSVPQMGTLRPGGWLRGQGHHSARGIYKAPAVCAGLGRCSSGWRVVYTTQDVQKALPGGRRENWLALVQHLEAWAVPKHPITTMVPWKSQWIGRVGRVD